MLLGNFVPKNVFKFHQMGGFVFLFGRRKIGMLYMTTSFDVYAYGLRFVTEMLHGIERMKPTVLYW